MAMNIYAKRTCRSLIVANPCNALMYALRKFTPDFPKENFTCLSRLD